MNFFSLGTLFGREHYRRRSKLKVLFHRPKKARMWKQSFLPLK